MLSCSTWFSAPSFWMGGGLESCCVGHVYSADGAVHSTIYHLHRTHDLHGGSQDHIQKLGAENHVLQLNI